MKKEIKNLPASVHDRLFRLAKKGGRPFQEQFYYYAFERFLYRLSKSSHANSFILKGGLIFIGWGIPLRRPTRDIDVQGYLSNTIDHLVSVTKEICMQDVEPDGMRFDPESVRGEQIMNEADYKGVKIYFNAHLGEVSFQLHMDVSFANAITPEAILINFPSLLGMPEFKILGYPFETSIAEKFQAMVVLADINDRMKDYFDIWLLSQQVDIPGQTMASAIQATFLTRNTPLPSSIPIALSDEFGQLRQPDWERLLRRSMLEVLDYPSFVEVVSILRDLLWPVVQAIANDESYNNIWKARGPWKAI